MIGARPSAAVIATVAAGLVWGCGPRRVQTEPRPGQDRVVLLPDTADGTVGRAVVSTPAGSTELAAARESTIVSPNKAPAPIIVMSEADAQLLFGEALTALPRAAQHFTLYFRFESDELTDESRALMPPILQAVKDHPFPEVAVVGHTDTTGTPAGNIELGLRRANSIRKHLVAAQVPASLIEVTSEGEADLLINTADEVFEPRNRRVEITVR